MEAIINSEIFQEFIKSGVKDLKAANVVNPNRNKKQNRMSFLGKVKGDGGQKAEVNKIPLVRPYFLYISVKTLD